MLSSSLKECLYGFDDMPSLDIADAKIERKTQETVADGGGVLVFAVEPSKLGTSRGGMERYVMECG